MSHGKPDGDSITDFIGLTHLGGLSNPCKHGIMSASVCGLRRRADVHHGAISPSRWTDLSPILRTVPIN